MATYWTESDIERLERSIAEGLGAGEMTFENQTVRFESIEQRLRLLSVMRAAVASAAGTSQRTRYASTSKGV